MLCISNVDFFFYRPFFVLYQLAGQIARAATIFRVDEVCQSFLLLMIDYNFGQFSLNGNKDHKVSGCIQWQERA